MNMKIKTNPDKDYVKEIKTQLKENNGHCPCKLVRTADTKCICKEFRNMIKHGESGACHCGLYIAEKD